MKKYGVSIFLMLLGVFFVFVPRAAATDPMPGNNIVFSEILMGTSASASQEFIELYNNTNADITLTGWHVQYVSATRTDWTSPTRNIALSGVVAAKSYYLITSSGYLTSQSNLSYSAAIAQAGGHLRILNSSAGLEDQIGWGNAGMALGTAANAVDANSSIARLTNSAGYNLSEDNSTDFASTLSPTPLADNVITVPPDTSDTSSGTGSSGSDNSGSSPPVTISYPVVKISEILPNPASPQTDANDEFVELYNPNNYDIDLTGYAITTGLNATYKFVIKDLTIVAGDYQTFYSGKTNLSLSNSAGRTQLLSPDSSLMDETDDYSNAPEGQSWINNDGVWVWTIVPTPNTDNMLSIPVPTVAKTTKASAKTPKAKSLKVKAPKAAKKKSTTATKPLAAATPAPTATVHPGVLAGVGSSALLYAMYEYRNDLANSVYRARRYRESRRPFWPAFEAARNSELKRRFGRWQNHLRTRLSKRFRK